MSEHRRQILEMLSEGKVNADEAERLISASEGPSSLSSEPGSASAGKSRPKYLRVQVDSEDDGGRDGPTKVNVRVPHAVASRRGEAGVPDSRGGHAKGEPGDA
jgi:hypothetical protein